MDKTTTPTPSENFDGLDRAIKARAAALEALKRTNPAALDGYALQKQLAGERFEASPKRKAKVAAWQKAMERGEPVALDLEPEGEEAERWACAEISRRAGAESGFELVREPGVTYVRAARERPRRGRSPRPATNDKRRGSKRSSVRRSSERSGDSGSEDGEPPPARECAWCGEPIDHLNADARYCGAKHRVYAQRARDRQLPERVAARAAENGASGRAKPCRCWPHHDLVDRNVCVKCGHARGAVAIAWITEARDLRSKQLVARAPARRNPRLGDGKRRPPNEFVDESIIGAAA